jgi:hypothetical protein
MQAGCICVVWMGNVLKSCMQRWVFNVCALPRGVQIGVHVIWKDGDGGGCNCVFVNEGGDGVLPPRLPCLASTHPLYGRGIMPRVPA